MSNWNQICSGFIMVSAENQLAFTGRNVFLNWTSKQEFKVKLINFLRWPNMEAKKFWELVNLPGAWPQWNSWNIDSNFYRFFATMLHWNYIIVIIYKHYFSSRGAGMVQWWEGLSPTNVAWILILPWCTGAICGLSLLLVLALFRGFLSGFSNFPPSTKPSISKFQLHQERGPAWKPTKADVTCSLIIYLFIYLFIIPIESVKYSCKQHLVKCC